MEELDANAQQRRETFARYGLAMYHAQCVEKSIAILVANVFNNEFLPSDGSRREEINDEVFSKTIGELVTRLGKQVTVPADLRRTLEEARKKRNWLAHEYFWVRGGEILTARGRDIMTKELTEASDWFSCFDTHLMSICERWIEKLGIPQETIEEALRSLIRRNE